MQRRQSSDVQPQQSGEDSWMLPESMKRSLLQTGTPIENKQHPRHPQRSQSEPRMFDLIVSQVAGFETLRQRYRLTECQTKAFSRDRIHRAGSVTDQSHILSPYALKLEVPSQSASLGREGPGSLQARPQTWQFPQPVLQPETGFVRCQGHTDLVRPRAY